MGKKKNKKRTLLSAPWVLRAAELSGEKGDRRWCEVGCAKMKEKVGHQLLAKAKRVKEKSL